MIYEHGVQEMSNVPVNGSTVVFKTIPANVQLKNSQNRLIDAGTVQYYAGSWYDLGVTSDGVAKKELLPANYKFRMSYAHASNEKYQNVGIDSMVVFQTVPTKVELRNSQSALIDTGVVKYYSGGWYDLGVTTSGIATMELLPYNYKFRMTYAKGSNEKYQDVGTNPTVIFQTTNARVVLRNSQGNLMDGGVVQYYSGTWYNLGSTAGGMAAMELLPYNYKFRITYAKGSNEKYQDIGVNPTVVFQTTNARVELRNSQRNLMDRGVVQYYSGAWYNLGSTASGVAAMELLPYNYKFRMTYAKGSNEKYQDIGVNPTVVFQTSNARVELRNSQGNLMDGGAVQYYSGAWYDLGSTSGGVAAMELLPYNYKFRMTYAKGSNEKYQDIGVNPTVVFQTINVRVEIRNSQGNLMDGGVVQYYSGAWYNLGSTSGGMAAMELLPYNYKFRMTYANGSNEKYQDIGVNPVVPFQTVLATVKANNLQGQSLNNIDVKYYSGAWYPFGLTLNGTATKELLPFNYKFRVTSGSVQSEKYQDLTTNPVVEFSINAIGG